MTLRKQKVELDIQLQALQNQLKKREEDHARVIEKERHRVEKLKESLNEWTVRLEFICFVA